MGEESKQTGADWFNPGGGGRAAAKLWFEDGVVCAQNENDERRRVPIADVEISSRMSGLPRRLIFPDGVTVVAEDNDFVDAALTGRKKASSFLHKFEDKWQWVVASILMAVAVGWALVAFALPAVTEAIAERVPQETLAVISESTYQEFQTSEFIQPTRLPPQKVAKVRALFAETVGDDDKFNYRLRVHQMILDKTQDGDGIANAFALPDGLVIATDRIIALLTERELAAVFAHELSHIRRRHGLRLFLESSVVFLFATFVLGDVSLILSSGAALLVQSKYSRDFEREADCDAYDFLIERGESPELMSAALTKMEDDHALFNQPAGDEKQNSAEENKAREVAHTIFELLSTHPATRERINYEKQCNITTETTNDY